MNIPLLTEEYLLALANSEALFDESVAAANGAALPLTDELCKSIFQQAETFCVPATLLFSCIL